MPVGWHDCTTRITSRNPAVRDIEKYNSKLFQLAERRIRLKYCKSKTTRSPSNPIQTLTCPL